MALLGKLVLALALGLGAEALITAPRWTTSRQAVKVEAAVMTKFDRMKAKYRGPVNEVDATESGFSYDDFSGYLEKQVYSFGRGDTVMGTVVQYEPGGALVDIGSKSAALLPMREAALTNTEHIEDAVDIDEKREFQIISEENEDGQLLLSIRRIEYRLAWEKIVAAQAEDKAFDCEVVGVNKGGCLVLLHGLRAFLPGSHLCGAIASEELIGESFKVKFLEVDQENNKLVVSNRRAMVEDSMVEIKRGDVVQGIVRAIKPYGAFVDINGISGLLHISQISYDRVEDIEAALQTNTVIKCMIIDHDKVNGRIALSTKTLEPEPGDMLRDPAKVMELADETAAKYHARMEEERIAREEAAKDIVMGLGDLDSSGSSDLESILNPAE
mmetsp:Transcript_8232/g.18790  ORF Transcript_8232/g.18790 Transcript_8232/m.18790 type:complete len:385 (+) Transcript_8232:63-1217(+)|eukprot:CAMPEP_0172591038 /NCGR_PEP_ID=MMETSP1068-20121228/9720_1 /TAXON_ID=35684 /ORGANISM="Pseudopedinella elastica, Strain CCMP716" /LENGTH=384 /DNA_ID=CAMNT_0013387253 /DNA_START=29 /DNA_END=1183 /DNA_ORIENTATION=-